MIAGCRTSAPRPAPAAEAGGTIGNVIEVNEVTGDVWERPSLTESNQWLKAWQPVER